MRHRGSPHLPWAKPEQTLEQTTSPRACGPLPLVQIQPMVLRPMPYAQSYNGGSLSQFSSVETETPLSKHSVSQRLPGFAQEGEHNRLSSCLHHVRLVWGPMLLLPAQPHTLPPFLSGACSVCVGVDFTSYSACSVSWVMGFLDSLPGPLVRQLVTERCLKTCPCHQIYFTGL